MTTNEVGHVSGEDAGSAPNVERNSAGLQVRAQRLQTVPVHVLAAPRGHVDERASVRVPQPTGHRTGAEMVTP